MQPHPLTSRRRLELEIKGPYKLLNKNTRGASRSVNMPGGLVVHRGSMRTQAPALQTLLHLTPMYFFICL